MSKPTLSLALLTLSLLACGPRGETGIPEGREKPWAEMDHDERMEHMATVVMPRLRPIFQGHDPERFADFNCATCHGAGASSGEFHMPNPDLPTIDAANFYKQHRKESPEILKIMWKEVEPAMGEALALTYGFDGQIECGSCHVVVNRN